MGSSYRMKDRMAAVPTKGGTDQSRDSLLLNSRCFSVILSRFFERKNKALFFSQRQWARFSNHQRNLVSRERRGAERP